MVRGAEDQEYTSSAYWSDDKDVPTREQSARLAWSLDIHR